jgi:glycyl-tRNA synthetase (class II)
MDKIISLAKRRGFIYPTSEIYGGLASSYDYGPLGAELLRAIRNLGGIRARQCLQRPAGRGQSHP